MHIAIKAKLQTIAKTFLVEGADPTICTNQGEDCMKIAQKSGQLDLIAELVKRGAKLRPVSAASTPGGRFRLPKDT